MDGLEMKVLAFGAPIWTEQEIEHAIPAPGRKLGRERDRMRAVQDDPRRRGHGCIRTLHCLLRQGRRTGEGEGFCHAHCGGCRGGGGGAGGPWGSERGRGREFEGQMLLGCRMRIGQGEFQVRDVCPWHRGGLWRRLDMQASDLRRLETCLSWFVQSGI